MREIINEGEAARRWGMSHITLRNWRVAGDGPPYQQVGRTFLYEVADLEKWRKKNPEKFEFVGRKGKYKAG